MIDLVIEETFKLNRGNEVDLRPNFPKGSNDIILQTVWNEMESSFSGFLINEFDD